MRLREKVGYCSAKIIKKRIGLLGSPDDMARKSGISAIERIARSVEKLRRHVIRAVLRPGLDTVA